MSNLSFKKVNTLPTVLQPNTIYFLLVDNKLSIHLSDNTGTNTYRTINPTDVVPNTATVINIVDELPEITPELKPGFYALGSVDAIPVWYDGNDYKDLFKMIGTGSNADVCDATVLRDALEFGITLT